MDIHPCFFQLKVLVKDYGLRAAYLNNLALNIVLHRRGYPVDLFQNGGKSYVKNRYAVKSESVNGIRQTSSNKATYVTYSCVNTYRELIATLLSRWKRSLHVSLEILSSFGDICVVLLSTYIRNIFKGTKSCVIYI